MNPSRVASSGPSERQILVKTAVKTKYGQQIRVRDDGAYVVEYRSGPNGEAPALWSGEPLPNPRPYVVKAPKKPGCSKCRYLRNGCSQCAPHLPRRQSKK